MKFILEIALFTLISFFSGIFIKDTIYVQGKVNYELEEHVITEGSVTEKFKDIKNLKDNKNIFFNNKTLAISPYEFNDFSTGIYLKIKHTKRPTRTRPTKRKPTKNPVTDKKPTNKPISMNFTTGTPLYPIFPNWTLNTPTYLSKIAPLTFSTWTTTPIKCNTKKPKLNEKQCQINEVYLNCGSKCPTTCETIHKGPHKNCSEDCIKGCYCAQGYYRNPIGKCVLATECD